MCGIVGVVSESAHEKNKIHQATSCVFHRGPDSEGFYKDELIAMGHRRLSIIDLNSGNQPMLSDDKRYIIVYNGEFYNFKEIKKLLITKGVQFSTNSDTEVFLKGFITYGIRFLPMVNGMFSFAIWDNKKNKLYLGRDRYGEKPLYFYRDDDRFIFSSETKSILSFGIKKKINAIALNHYFSLTAIPAPYSIFEGIHKLRPSSVLTFENDSFSVTPYYDLKNKIHSQNIISDESQAKKGLKERLTRSVEKRMIADVEVGAFLSGGIDSSIIVGLMSELSTNPINTFTIGFKEKDHDESKNAELIARFFKTNHTSHVLSYQDILHSLDDVLLHFDEPFADSSAIPSWVVSKLASEKLKVVLTGDCADELFGGYNKYLIPHYAKKLSFFHPFLIKKALPIGLKVMSRLRVYQEKIRQVERVIQASELTGFDQRFQMMCLAFSPDEREALFSDSFFNSHPKKEISKIYESLKLEELSKALFTDVQFALESDMLVKIDRMSMFHSLESRVPFLDPAVVEFAFQINDSLKIRKNNKKYILKRAFESMLPKEILKLPKKGFTVPVEKWMKNQLKSEIEQLLSKEHIGDQGLFNFEPILRMKREHFSGYRNHRYRLWALFVFQKWYKNHFN